MSGGHWDYEQFRVRECMQNVGEDGQVIIRFPKLAQVMRDLGEVLEDIIHDLDWDLSGDTEIDDDPAFEASAIRSIGAVISKKYKIRVYEITE